MMRTLCNRYTNLTEADIIILEEIVSRLEIFAELVRADLFVDCITRDPNVAVVVAQSHYSKSVYKNEVVGEMAYRKNEPAVLRTLELGLYSKDFKGITQENIAVKQNVVPIKNKDDKVIGVLIMERDVSEDINNQRNLELLMETNEVLTEALFHNNIEFTDYINEGIIIFDDKGTVTFVNKGASDIYEKLGYQDELLGMNYQNIVFNNLSIDKLLTEKYISKQEFQIAEYNLEVRYIVMNKNSGSPYIVMLVKDVTEVRKKEKELILKSVAMSEIHHRVKNNLQTIASLLRLQSRRINNDLVRKAFDESISRIHSIAVTHEILARKGVDNIDIKEMLLRIVENFRLYSNSSHTDISFNVIGDTFDVGSDMATSIAMVVNEVLQNSIEYAFVGKEMGNVDIMIERGKFYSTVSIIDDGVGFDIKEIRKGSLGVSIVKSIVKDKLSGIFNITSNKTGTKVVFDFKNE